MAETMKEVEKFIREKEKDVSTNLNTELCLNIPHE